MNNENTNTTKGGVFRGWTRMDKSSPRTELQLARQQRVAQVAAMLVLQPKLKSRDIATLFKVTQPCARLYLNEARGAI